MNLCPRPIFAVVRFAPSIGWYVQEDAGHDPCGVSSAAAVGGQLRIFFADPQAKVGALSLVPDNVLTKYGYRASGPACGNEVAAFELPREIGIQGFVYWNGTAFVLDQSDPCHPCAIENVSTGLPGAPIVIRVHHDALRFAQMVPIVTMLDGGYDNVRPSGWNATSFDVVIPDTTPSTPCKFLFARKGPDLAFVENGYANPDGNYWLTGFMWVR